MELKDLLCAGEQSTVLWDLGFRQKSYFCWRWDRQRGMNVEPYINDEYSKTRAYTIGELMLILPKKIGPYYMRVEPDDVGWNITYCDDFTITEGQKLLCSVNDANLAHCLASCLIWLIKEGWVKVEELKL